MRINF